MKFFRILPETWVNTSWLFSSLTLNMALGRVSTTTAMTSIASSFDKPHPIPPAQTRVRHVKALAGFTLAQMQTLNELPVPGPVAGNRVLEVSAHASILGHSRPAVAENFHVRASGVHHRLDGDHHAHFQLHAPSPLSEIRYLRVFVHVDSNPMAHKIAYYRESLGFNNVLHSRTDVAQRCTRFDRRNAGME